MSRNGSGTYTLPAGNPVVTNTTISSTWANSTLTDIASALTGSVAADGQTPITGSLNLNSNKIINLATPTLDTDGATKLYVDTADALALLKANNLSDVANATTSRTNLSAAKSGANSDITSITGLTTALAASQGGTGLTSAGASGNVLVSNGTTWTSASGNVRGGITTVTLSTASPSATLTSASNQYIRAVLNTTTPYAPSIVLPDMTTLVTGQGYFVISTETGMPLAIKDTGGTVREFLPSGNEYSLNITSVATSNGVWYFNNAPVLVGDSVPFGTWVARSTYMTTTTANLVDSSLKIVTLDSTNFALVFTEVSTVYAKLFTVNTSTGVFTAGNKLTIAASSNSTTFGWDTDNAGHALIMFAGASGNVSTCGLSVSGGTLYASTVNNAALGGATGENSAFMVAYLGSNSAYATGWTYNTGPCSAGNAAIRGATVTGTTTVTMTQSASNSTSAIDINYVRTSLTTFIMGGQYVSYTPSANTYTKGARTTQTQAEQFNPNQSASFGQTGWTYCSGKTTAGGTIFDVTNTGAAGVTAVLAASYSAKPFISTNYVAFSSTQNYYPLNSAFVVSSSKILGISNLGASASNSLLAQVDQSSSTYNLNLSGVPYTAYSNTLNQQGQSYSQVIMLSATGAIGYRYFGATGTGGGSAIFQYVPIATSIV